ncbi:MAG: phosphatidylserine decarboxylase [Planctomycetota bacterium]|nr:phosphatidylserine decarboxylase [Planctomycetota bacterium]
MAIWLFWPVAVLPALVWVYVLCFFRDPQRRPAEENAFISPADGKVVDITPVGAESPLGTDGVRIGIFMSIFDVHVNRSPCAAAVVKIEHRPGGYADARKPEAAERNESSTICLSATGGDGRAFPVVVRQIAGLIARRIVTDLCVGQKVITAQQIGMVKFGSRVETMIPHNMIGEIAVQIGQTVRAGRTVLARPTGTDQASQEK